MWTQWKLPCSFESSQCADKYACTGMIKGEVCKKDGNKYNFAWQTLKKTLKTVQNWNKTWGLKKEKLCETKLERYNFAWVGVHDLGMFLSQLLVSWQWLVTYPMVWSTLPKHDCNDICNGSNLKFAPEVFIDWTLIYKGQCI